MQIYPAIDIKNGQCVRLRQGKFDDVTVYGDDPIKVAESFVKSGATYLHIVDLDGARNGMSYNQEIIKEIVEASIILFFINEILFLIKLVIVRYEIILDSSSILLGSTIRVSLELLKVKFYKEKSLIRKSDFF